MKNLKILLIVLLASTFSLTSFANVSEGNPESDLRQEILDYIDQPSTTVYDSEYMVTNLKFMVNSDRELVVVDTGTENERLDNYLKNKLNYKRVDTNQVEYHKMYSVKVIFKS